MRYYPPVILDVEPLALPTLANRRVWLSSALLAARSSGETNVGTNVRWNTYNNQVIIASDKTLSAKTVESRVRAVAKALAPHGLGVQASHVMHGQRFYDFAWLRAWVQDSAQHILATRTPGFRPPREGGNSDADSPTCFFVPNGGHPAYRDALKILNRRLAGTPWSAGYAVVDSGDVLRADATDIVDVDGNLAPGTRSVLCLRTTEVSHTLGPVARAAMWDTVETVCRDVVPSLGLKCRGYVGPERGETGIDILWFG
jgi:hypothetical protein